ncbi:tyrosine-type recombinase/integrase, partial [Methylobacterium sp. 2A]|nr:tyrosine-type recombinase/integrase [Methylobacterium sp. 2A]
MASVYKRGRSGKETYWVRFQWQGREVRRSARTSSKAVAQQYLAHLLEQHRRIGRGGRPRCSYGDALDRFGSEYLPTLKPSTQARYRESFKHLTPRFGSFFLDEINKSMLGEFVTTRKEEGVTGATIRRDLATLSSMFSCAVAWDLIELNPVRQFSKKHIREAPPRTSYPCEEEVERLVAHAPPMIGLLIRLLAQTGMRQEEACSLEWKQVSIERREIRLWKTKTSSPRTIPLSDDALGTIVGTPQHRDRRYVFWHGEEGQRYTHFASRFAVIAKRAKVPWRCHDLRHRFASVFLQETGDLAALQAILGHRHIAMTL